MEARFSPGLAPAAAPVVEFRLYSL